MKCSSKTLMGWVENLAYDQFQKKKFHFEPTSSSKGSKRKGAMLDFLREQFQVFNNGITEVAAALREGNHVLHEGNLVLKEGQPRIYSEEEVFKELENIGVEEDLQFLACMDFLDGNLRRSSWCLIQL
ncbi:hypothetical protein RHMOL_Rhmol03G0040900 [Rhododendron molle]|uniref:Uncharacterized protein n=2 Tax=Rhododendron molle TaxID=49168 RepID=A0ACC0PAQ2_RHOML|nr:hypothetical protein RHMOL_Rhmol03G0040900 [Rhododendron molle]KAI8562501.1 hypothetical protein RHMOL_Rhmol03G0040900 [Rhododendron molle]